MSVSLPLAFVAVNRNIKGESMDIFGPLLAILLFVAIYFIPGIVAHIREHHQENAIVLLNLFLGWTLLGWIIALVWAATAVRKDLQ